MRFHVAATALAALPLYISGCALISGRCTYETRYVMAEGRVMDGAMVVANGSLQIAATRGSQNNRTLNWTIAASSLDEHITAVRLVESTDPTKTLLDLAIFRHPSLPGTILGGEHQESDDPSPALGGIFEIVRGNRAVFEIATDLPDRPRVNIPLTVVQTEDWTRPYCS